MPKAAAPRTRQNDAQKALQANVASARAQLADVVLPSSLQIFGIVLIVIFVLFAFGGRFSGSTLTGFRC